MHDGIARALQLARAAAGAVGAFLTRMLIETPAPKPEPEGLLCTYCGGDQFFEGPSGGLSTNVMCANEECEHWFNDHGGMIPTDDLHQVGWDRKSTRSTAKLESNNA